MKISIYLLKKQWIYLSRVCFILLASLSFPLFLNAQNQKITLPQGQKTILSAFEEIEKQTGMTIAYTETVIDVKRTTQVSIVDKSLQEAMSAILQGTNTTYKVHGQQIIIVSAPKQVVRKRYTGVVLDDKGEFIIGASIVLKNNTSIGTVTDIDGNFSIEAPVGSTLVVSYIGFISQETKLGDLTSLGITLREDSKLLDEVVVVGYGVQRKRDVTTSIASIKASDIEDIAVSSIEQALVGRMAGVQITQPNGTPGAGFGIKVRGVGTITAGSSPLYVIDGVPLSDDTGSATGITVSPLASINSQDIESIEVLKDASAAAIYGSRGSNGVVIITTKKGLEGKPVVKYSAQAGVQAVTRKIDVLNAYEYADLVYEAHNSTYYDQLVTAGLAHLYDPKTTNQDRWDLLRTGSINQNQSWMIPPEILPYINGEEGLTNTNWQDEVLRNGFIQQHNLSISGGNTNAKYFISANYRDEEGVVINSSLEKMGFRTKVDINYNKWKLGGNISLTRNIYNLVNSEGRYADDGVLSLALGAAPIYPVYNDDGSFNYEHHNISYGNSKLNNPVAVATLIKDKMTSLQMLATGYAEYELMKGLSLKTQGSWHYNNYVRDYYRPASLPNSTNRTPPSNPTAESRTKNKYTWVWENTLNYKKRINKVHSITGLAGWTAQRYQGNANRITATDLPQNDLLETIPNSSTATSYDSSKDAWSLLSALARAQYAYSDKYLFSAAIRADGSSRFGPNNRWGYFPSVSGAWYMTEESFLKPLASWLTNLKLRASWGVTGNMNIGNYASYGIVNGDNYIFGDQMAIGMKESTAGNADLGWEKTSQVNLGMELGLFNWLNIEMDVYKGITSDMLLNVPVMQASGFSTVLQNIGKVSNKGIELTLSTNHKIGSVMWSNSVNYAANRNKVLSLGEDATQIVTQANSVIDFITKVGQPIGNYYTYVVDGIYQSQAEIETDIENGIIVPGAKPGDFRFKKFGDDDTINDDDKTITGNYMPKFTYGYTTNMKYKDFDFSLSLQGVYGNKIANINRRYLANMEGNANQLGVARDRWRSTENPGNGSVYRGNRIATGMNSAISTWHIEDGSYMRIREITLGYSLPKLFLKRYGIAGLRVYASTFNPFTFTKYSGYNPEVSTNSSPVMQGVDYGTYPLSKSIVFGVNFNL